VAGLMDGISGRRSPEPLGPPTSRTTAVQRVMRIAAFTAVGSLVGIIMLLPLQRRLIYFPSNIVDSVAVVLPQAEEVSFDTDDGLTLAGWFVPAGASEDPVTVVIFNGNGGNRSNRVLLARGLLGHGFGVLLFDYRGYGGNEGKPSERGLMADGQAAVRYLETRADVDSDRLVYFGESLGAAVALATAEYRPPAILALRSPFTSLPEVASVHFPFLPVAALVQDKYPNEERIRHVDVPTIVIAGSSDRTVPVEQSERVYQAAADPRKLVIIEGADHNDQGLSAGADLLDEIVDFIDGVLNPESG
jgi:fermentation-respiration switch protein FrsA (DUF1100 family)